MNTWTAKAHHLRQTQAAILCQILNDLDPDDPALETYKNRQRLDPRSGAGDHTRLRMIPVHARGVGGTIPNTEPLRALIGKQPND